MSVTIDVECDEAVVPASDALVTTVRKSVETILLIEGFDEGKSCAVAVLITGDERIRELNREFAGEDHVTDVLAFQAEPITDISQELDDAESVGFIGDIAISAPQTERQASDKGCSFERELSMLAIHGTLHLLGYDHAEPYDAKVMFGKTDRALVSLFKA